jgi:PAS domain S-box-containing protein
MPPMNGTVGSDPLRLLVVEDDPADAELAVGAVRRAGWEVITDRVVSAPEVAERLRTQRYDAVVTDYRMPGWTGLDAARLVRETNPELPVILITGTLGDEAAVECLKQGVWDYVLKDNLVRLPMALRRALHERSLMQQRARAERELRASEERYRSLIRGAVYGIYRSSATADRFLHVNPALVSMLGYESEDDLLAADLGSDVYADPSERARVIDAQRQGDRIRGVQVRWRRKNGTIITAALSGRQVRNDEGEVVAYDMIAEDVTQRRVLEEQLRQSQKMEAIGRLAGGVAHDFNNLLTIILGFTDLVMNGLSEDDPLRSHLADVRQAGESAADLTRQLLAFSRQQVAQPRVVELSDVLMDTDKMLRRLIGEDIALKTALAKTSARVFADRGHLEQVVLNLAVNARDAMPNGGRLTLEVQTAVIDDAYSQLRQPFAPGRYVMLAVSDTGIGMDEDTLEHLFEPFFTTKDRGKGTGLGLATVYGIVKQAGGYIWVYSEVGLGTTFKVYLPQVDHAVAPSERVGPGPARAQQGTETVLVVEDDAMVRDLTCRILEMNGYTVIPASGGDDAIAQAVSREERIHLMVTDVVMPGMSGRDLARRMIEHRPDVKVLYVSGYTNDAVVHHGILEPNIAFLQKPFATSQLLETVRSVLDDPEAGNV